MIHVFALRIVLQVLSFLEIRHSSQSYVRHWQGNVSERAGKTLGDARREVRAEIQGLMNYLEEYLVAHPDQAPTDKVIVFDEAQRAWDAEYGAQKFSRRKSEPALFLEIMERHDDWAVIIALVGGGQEINRGERGLAEWGTALNERQLSLSGPRWRAIAPPDIATGSDATAWQSLISQQRITRLARKR